MLQHRLELSSSCKQETPADIAVELGQFWNGASIETDRERPVAGEEEGTGGSSAVWLKLL